MSDELLIEHKDYICTITINRPDKRNALNYEVLSGLSSGLDALANDDKTRVIILTGAGGQAFSAGMDLVFVNSQREIADKAIADALDSLINCQVPVIAKIQADALGAGCDLTTACDFRIALRLLSSSTFVWAFLVEPKATSSLVLRRFLFIFR